LAVDDAEDEANDSESLAVETVVDGVVADPLGSSRLRTAGDAGNDNDVAHLRSPELSL
jgi:hypothetical protein